MATAVVPVQAPTSTAEDAFRIVPWASCHPSPLNPRKHFDPDALKELAGTMGSDVGVIEPLVVRPTKNKGQYEIVAGERRWRAADLAGLTQVPVIVREGLTDVQVLRIMVIENKQRQDLNALEEGEGFYQLTKRGVPIDTIAGDIKASRKYVYDRIKLRDLTPVGQQLLVRGRITAGHAILIARLGQEQQMRVFALDEHHPAFASPLFEDDRGELTAEEEAAQEVAAKTDPYVGLKPRSVRELDTWIAQHVRFDARDAVSQALYPETAREVEAAEKVIHITRNHHTQPEAKEGSSQRIYHASSWKRADGGLEHSYLGKATKSKPCDRSVLGVVVVGPGRGESFKVCVDKACDVHWKAERQAREKATKQGQSSTAKWKEQQERERQRYEAEQRKREAERQAWAKAAESIVEAFAAKVKTASPAVLASIVVEALERRGDYEDCRAAVEKVFGKAKTADEHLRVLAQSIVVAYAEDDWSGPRVLAWFAKTLGIDLEKLVKAHVQTSAPTAKAAKKKQSKGGRRG